MEGLGICTRAGLLWLWMGYVSTGETDAAGNLDSQVKDWTCFRVCLYLITVQFPEYKSDAAHSEGPLWGIMMKLGLVLLFAAYGKSAMLSLCADCVF